MSESVQERIQSARREAENLKENIKVQREEMNDTTRKLIKQKKYTRTQSIRDDLVSKLIYP